MPTPEPPREDGWYRLAEHAWVRVSDERAEAEIAEGGGWDLVRITTVDTGVTEPLF